MSSQLPLPPEARQQQGRPVWKRWWFWVIVVVVLLIIAGLTSPEEVTVEGATEQLTPTQQPTMTETPSGTTPASAPVAKVPKVEGDEQSDAVTLLEDAGFTVDVETKLTDAEPRGTVLQQSIRGRTEAELGSTVVLVVAKPLPRVPDVVGKTRGQATRILKNAGFKFSVRLQQSTTERDGLVVAQSPAAGTSSRPGRTIKLTVIDNICAPGYSPCLREGPSDYDCYGGTGNGPAYTAAGVTYRVTGFDPYGLDADNDGYGCE